MKLLIAYNSCWRAGLLEGSDSKPYFNKNRKVLRKGKKEQHVPIPTPISKNTVLGIVYRLIGEQRKIWRILENGEYLGINNVLNFNDKTDYISKDAIALREIGNAENPCGWAGITKKESNVYFTDPNIYNILCYPLLCKPIQLYDLIINNKIGKIDLKIKNRLDVLSIIKNINNDNINILTDSQKNAIMLKLKQLFPKVKYKDKDIDKYSIFCLSGMYICAGYLKNIGYKQTGQNWNKGISHRNDTPKEFYAAISSGKNTVINFPMDDNWRNKTKKIQKPTGCLEIDINVNYIRAQEIKRMIDSANVGCISVGKKGLAYLNGIII